MVNTVLPANLESMGLSCYTHDPMRLRWAVIGAEDARRAKHVEMSMLQWRQLSEDPKRGWMVKME